MHGNRLWFAGLGLRRDCRAGELAALLAASCGEAGIEMRALHALACLDLRVSEPGLQDLAETLGLVLHALPARRLAAFNDRLSQHSPRIQARYGVGGIAEAAALASAAAGHTGATPRLAVTRRQSAAATVAIAVRETAAVPSR
ncbi:cobalamin biosynthesis protein [Salinisphaera sp. RV14]|uniref:cobalamin biosynthesis protein n=1 Tax=Salinisphaera sp. RV14 TaxID=3454140 RepID=UPI003F831229